MISRKGEIRNTEKDLFFLCRIPCQIEIEKLS